MKPLYLLALIVPAVLSTLVEFPFENMSMQSPIADDGGLDQSPIALDAPRIVTTSDGHFTRGKNGERVRFWGVNLCFQGIFPSHEQAVIMAQRMRMVGINIVRFHHIDSDGGVYPYSYWAKRNSTQLSDAAIDSVHFLISELAKNGIYSNMNLHVNKRWSMYLNLPNYEYFGSQDKIVNFVSHKVTEMHKWLTKELLSRKNPYRGNLTFLEDPAIAIVEISNENSLFMWSADEVLSKLPEYYSSEFHANFTKWLKTKYGTTEKLRAAWQPANPKECEASLSSRVCQKKPGAKDLVTKSVSKWYLGKTSGADATLTENSDGSATIAVTKTSTTNWHLQLSHGGMALDVDKTYIIEFSARSLGGDRPLAFQVAMNEDPWGQVTSGGDVTLGSSWKTYRYVRRPTLSFNNTRLTFIFATSSTSFKIANVSFAESDCDYTKDNFRNWDDWWLNVISPAQAKQTFSSDGSTTIETTKVGPANWYVQYMITSLQVAKDTTYTIFLYAKSTADTTMTSTMCVNDVCEYGSGVITKDVQRFAFSYTPPADGRLKLLFSVGGKVAKVTIYNISMAAGGCTGLRDSETIDNAKVLPKDNMDTTQKKVDRDVFLAVLESRYFDTMRDYIKNTLGYPGLVTGTINFGPLALYGQHSMDFVDAHSYWSHPVFPKSQWSSTDWTVSQKPMSLNPADATFWRIVRVNGKPYTVTEYNHAAPADGQAETIPMIASWAALQDLDGIFIFAYAHGNHFDGGQFRMNGFFDIDYNPSKWTMMKNGALIYRNGLIPPLATTKVLDIAQYSKDPERDVLPELTKYQGLDNFLSKMWTNSTYEDWIRTRISYNYGFWPKVSSEVPWASTNDPATISWDKEAGFSVSTSRAIAFSGNTANARGKEYEWGALDLSAPELVSLTVAPYDGMRLNRSEKIAVVLAGRVENKGMKWTDSTRTSVSNNWGGSPPMCEMSVGKLKLKGIALPGTSCLWTPLDSEGLRLNESAETVVAGDDGVIALSPSPRTIWYVLECDRAGYPEDPVEPVEPVEPVAPVESTISIKDDSSSGKSKDDSSYLKVSWILMMALVLISGMMI